MAKKICIQEGHVNIQNNSIPELRNGTGAPGEAAFTARIAPRLADILKSKGFDVTVTDANANDNSNITNTDYDLFLAIHYDANVYGQGGGFVDVPDADLDGVNSESKRIRDVLNQVYYSGNTGIAFHPERSSVDSRRYYMWQFLTAKTPCCLIECGVGQDAHDSVILADTDRVCNGIARGLCQAFNVPFDVPAPTSTPQPTTQNASITDALNAFINKYKGQTNAGNTPENKGQCVGLVSLWQDVLGVTPHEYGNAKDLLANANVKFFRVIYNDPNDNNQFPVAGDIMVWDKTWGNGDGHTAVVTNANGQNFSSFEANDVTPDDPNGSCQILFHKDYRGVLGWLHPIIVPQTSQANYDGFLAAVNWLIHNPNGGTSQNRWNNVKNYVKAH